MVDKSSERMGYESVIAAVLLCNPMLIIVPNATMVKIMSWFCRSNRFIVSARRLLYSARRKGLSSFTFLSFVVSMI